MEKTIKVIREMQESGVIKTYAIGGGIATLYYIEPTLTYDLDIFFIPTEEKLDILSPIYRYLEKKGHRADKEHILIEGVPVQFIPVYNELIKEAVENAIESKYRGVKTRILRAEYLLAIALQTFRSKDRERVIKFLEETKIDKKYFGKILKKHHLHEKFRDFRKKYYEK